MNKEKKLITRNFLDSNNFKLVEKSPFENIEMPYYVNNSVILFFNTPVNEWDENLFLIGYGEMRCGKYYATTFRWIKYEEDVIKIFEAVKGKSI